MNVKKTRRRYTKDFKQEAVQLVHNRDGKVKEVANSLGIHAANLQRWVREHGDDPTYSFPGNGNLRLPDEEIRRLRKQLREVEEERDILKKALAYFADDQK